MSIAFDPNRTVTGRCTGGVVVRNRPTVGCNVEPVSVLMTCNSTTTSAPRSSRQGIVVGDTIGPRPGAQPMNCPSGSSTLSAMPSNPGCPSVPSRRRDADVRSTRITA